MILCTMLAATSLPAQVKEGYTENNGAKNFYQVWGEGDEIMLIINGGPGDE